MDQPKFSIGPYELFSSIIAGAPLLLTGILIYQPISGARELILNIKGASSLPIAVALILSASPTRPKRRSLRAPLHVPAVSTGGPDG